MSDLSGTPAYFLHPIEPSDQKAVIDIFNHYVVNSFAAYPDQPVPYEFFGIMMTFSHGYPAVTVKDRTGTVWGFGILRPHNPMPVFARTAEITCFIAPGMTGKGLGSLVIGYLEMEGKKRGIANILASISSRNEGSIRFHARHGFSECGRFREAGEKHGTLFDIVWMQKMIR
jgi:L-amino acid N-acyltransferase YncA